MEQTMNLMKEIPMDDFQNLLHELKQEHPNSVHVCSMLRTMDRWRTSDSSNSTKIMALNGDYHTKFILFYMKPANTPAVMASAYKWSHTELDEQIIQEALRNCHEFPWSSSGKIQFSALTEETSRVMLPIVQEIWKVAFDVSENDHVLWISKDDVMNLQVNIPTGTYIANLNKDHTELVNDDWTHRFNGSVHLIECCLRFNVGVGLFDSETHEIMAWALEVYHGGVGMLKTRENHLRKGYGAVVLKAITREIAKRGQDPHMVVIDSNIPSLTLAKRVNYQLAFRNMWIDK